MGRTQQGTWSQRANSLHMQEFDQFVTFIYTKDLQTSSRFLSNTLGLRLALDQGRCHIFRVAPHSYLGLCEREDPPPPSGVIVTLVTDDVDAWHEHLQASGVAIEKAPAHNPAYNIYHMFFRDPNGYLFEIQRFLDPSWPSD